MMKGTIEELKRNVIILMYLLKFLKCIPFERFLFKNNLFEVAFSMLGLNKKVHEFSFF
jgi:hypothetical protein